MSAERESRRDGVTFARGAAPWRTRAWLAAAFALLALAGWLAFVPRGAAPPGAAPEPGGPALSASSPAGGPPAEEPARRADGSHDRAGDDREPGAEPPQQLAGADDAAPSDGPPSGIGLFPPPGTDPVKIGIVVPEDFPLPEGYLRHYQVTDDGQPMPAILMFHPDYELLDEQGRPIPLPEDRVVPPELAPEGLPIELLVPPEPRAEEGAP